MPQNVTLSQHVCGATGNGNNPDELNHLEAHVNGDDGRSLGDTPSAGTRSLQEELKENKKPVKNNTDTIVAQLAEKLEK